MSGAPFPSEVASPCVQWCELDAETGWCRGCMRSMDEIAAWGALDDAQKREIWQRLSARRMAMGAAS